MTPNEALAELLTLSSQVRDVAILGESGFVLASAGSAERGERLAAITADLMAAAREVRPGADVARVEVCVGETTLFVVVEGGRTAVATTIPDPVAGLVVYDLRTMLQRLDAERPARAPRKRKKDAADA